MEQCTKEWFEARKGVFTASSIWKLMGKSIETDTAKTYIREKAMETLGIEVPSITTPAMQWGIDNEPLAFQWAKRRLEIDFKQVGFQRIRDKDMLLGGSADGLDDSHILEIKCPFNQSEHIKYKLEIQDAESLKSIKPEYFWQIQANMMIYERPIAWFVSFDPRLDKNLGWHTVLISDRMQAQILLEERVKQATEILNEYLKTLKP